MRFEKYLDLLADMRLIGKHVFEDKKKITYTLPLHVNYLDLDAGIISKLGCERIHLEEQEGNLVLVCLDFKLIEPSKR